jgi:hypothetical protein
VEQKALMALAVCNRGYVLEADIVSLDGTVGQLRWNPLLTGAYLGEGRCSYRSLVASYQHELSVEREAAGECGACLFRFTHQI